MRYKTRRNLFILFTLLFFISIVPIILYTQGYRLDAQKIALTKTGGLDLDVTTSNSEVYLNGKFQRETNFLFRNAVFRNIIPGAYNIEIKKDGYHVWSKMAVVEEGQVSKFPTIRLFPLELEQGILMKDVENIFISPDKRFSIIQTASPETTQGTTASQLTFYDLDVRLPIPLLTLQSGEEVRSVNWSSSGVFSILIDGPTISSLYAGTGSTDSLTNWSTFLNRSYPVSLADDSTIIPSNSTNSIYVLTLEGDDTLSLNRVELEQGIIRPDIVSGILGFQIIDEEIFYLDEFGSLSRTVIGNGNTAEISPTAISNPDKGHAEIVVRPDKRAVAVINNGSLFVWSEEQPLEKVDDEVRSAEFSPDHYKLLYTKEDEAVVFWTEEIFGPPKRMPGSTESIKFTGLQNATWVGSESNHIVMQGADSIVFTELDERDHRNTVTYEVVSNPDIFLTNVNREEMYTLLPNNNFVFFGYE